MFHMVGYLSSEVKEASERVRTAIRNSGMKLPAKKIIVNLAPATVRIRGASFDLPIALAVLAAMNYVPEEALKGVAVIGEVSLEGKIRGVSGVLPIVMEAKNQGCTACILPEENEIEGRLVSGIKILPADNLEKLCAYLNGDEKEIHRKINTIVSRESFESVKAELEDRYGALDNDMLVYMYEEWFEKLAKKVPLVNVWQTKNSIELLFDKKIINLIKLGIKVINSKHIKKVILDI